VGTPHLSGPQRKENAVMGETTLGPCHYSEDMSEEATLIAVLKDGTGWIPICEDHKSDAESEGYTPQEVVDVPDAMEQNKDMPAPEERSDSDDEKADDGEAKSGDADEADQGTDDTADQGTDDTEDTADPDDTDTGD
jgi:hypothetical protein